MADPVPPSASPATPPQGDPAPIPLGEAVARDLIPCSVCGSKGADVRQVAGKKHFLCPRCAARGRRWTWGALAAAAILVVLLVALRRAPSGSTPLGPAGTPVSYADLEEAQRKVVDLVQQKRFAEAQAVLVPLLDNAPATPILNLYMGRCCYGLNQYELSLEAWGRAAADPKNADECRYRLGEALQQLGYSSKAATFLEKPFANPSFQAAAPPLRAAILLDLEQYDEALKLLDTLPSDDPSHRFYRHRALLYLGKPDLARAVYAAPLPADRVYRIQALAGQAREEGDFAAALKILDDGAASLDSNTVDFLRVRRSRLAVYFESGDLKALETEATELTLTGEPRTSGEALWYRALGRLADGKRDLALADAKAFVGLADRTAAWLRLEILTMQHLLGQRSDADLEREARALNRFRANDVYYYLALATGKSEWAEKAAASTPGHNAPYHAIKRFLKK